MPHFDNEGREEWVCQKGAHVCVGFSTWVGRGSLLADRLRIMSGNVCDDCLVTHYERELLSLPEAKRIQVVRELLKRLSP